MQLFSKWFFMIPAKRFLFENSKNWLLKSSTKVLKPLGNCKEIKFTLNNDKEKEFAMIPYVLRHSTVLRSLMITWHRASIARSMLSHQLTKWSNPLQVEYSHQQLLINFQTSPIKIPFTTGNECMNFFQVKGVVVLVRSKFRFNEKQRLFLFKIFKHREQTGQTNSPEETHPKLRGCFSSNEYCTAKQICSLLSR